MSDEGTRRSRFLQLLPSEKAAHVQVAFVGLGNLGSKMALTAARMGFIVSGSDPDTVDESNLGTQAYLIAQEGQRKPEAMRQLMRLVGARDLGVGNFRSSTDPSGVTSECTVAIISTDSLESRREIFGTEFWRNMVSFEGADPLIVDVRMALESLEAYFIRLDEVGKHVKDTITGQEGDAVKLPCGATSVPYTGDGASALVMPQVRRHIMGFSTPHTILADLASGQSEALWREGEGFVNETADEVITRVSSVF